MAGSNAEAPSDIEMSPIPLEISLEAPSDIEMSPIPLEISLKRELDGLSPLSSLRCIYRVPERLRRGGPNVYTPQVVSIGPLHHGKEGLIAMEDHKKRYLQNLICRTNIRLKDYLVKIRDQEQKLRDCYAETIGLESDAFVQIILVDAAFIIELLMIWSFGEAKDKNDCIFDKPYMLDDLWHDMLLLENQVPFFILDELFNMDKTNVIKKLSLVDLSHRFFQSVMEGTNKLEKNHSSSSSSSSSSIEHFVDLIRKLYLRIATATTATAASTTTTATTSTTEDGRKLGSLNTPTVTELHLAGVKFKVRSSANLLDIQFHDGTLEIPKLAIGGETQVTIRNLLAFEQCHYIENYINDYVIIMDRLVNTSEDLALLVQHGILENRLGENSAGATLINNLADGVVVNSDDFQYATLCEDLNNHCKRHWNQWKALLCRKYFTTPWAGISLAAAVVLIVLAILQTVFSAMSAI